MLAGTEVRRGATVRIDGVRIDVSRPGGRERLRERLRQFAIFGPTASHQHLIFEVHLLNPNPRMIGRVAMSAAVVDVGPRAVLAGP